MHKEDLKNSLKEIHAHLESTANVDAELKNLLQVLDKDIQQLLNQEGTVAATASAEPGDLATRAQSISARFAAQHPSLEPALRELGNMLANMGI